VQRVPTYETVFITVPSLTDQEETDLVGSLAQVVTDDGGSLVANDRMGRRRMAYAVRKFEDGVYTRFLYDSTPAAPKELDRRIRLSDKILRHLTVRLEPDWAEAAKQQAVRDEQARQEAARLAAEGAVAAPAVGGESSHEAPFGVPPDGEPGRRARRKAGDPEREEDEDLSTDSDEDDAWSEN
jgi:small subunit ribosomal protein S6